jgi:hypothetical protein
MPRMHADLLRSLHKLLIAERVPSCSDRELLQRFLREVDEDAFATLMRQHGPMVLGVCRRVLRHEQDAEDAF